VGISSSPATQAIFASAKEEAIRRGQLIEPAHLMLAIIRFPDSGACKLLRCAVAPESLESELLRLVESAPPEPNGVPVKGALSRATKRAVEKSIPDAMRRGWISIDILLGVMGEGSSPAAELLKNKGVALEQVEALVSGNEDFVD
jgi:ATP-dependent Clp protease ATP-binding subunit ClpA